MNMSSKRIVTALPALLLCACASKPTATESNFGDSVRQIVRAQTYDPGTLTAPSAETIESGDGQRLEGVIEVYRTDIAKPETVDNEIVINVGGGNR